jgi:2-oxoisovalerate dehydrogenase E2 component (dihydrolipoyl transacylase)
MARFEFRLPDIGEGIAEAEIVAWHVKVGDRIEEDQGLADMMTDKATVEMESPVSGVVLEVAGAEGDMIAIGSTLVVIEVEGEEDDSVSPNTAHPEPVEGLSLPSSLTSELKEGQPFDRLRVSGEGVEIDLQPTHYIPPPEPGATEISVPLPSGQALASPAVRARAKSLGIDLAKVSAQGGGQIRHADLDALLSKPVASPVPRLAAGEGDAVIKVIGLRRRIAENMALSKKHIPHFSYVEEIDVTALEAMRAEINLIGGDRPKITVLPLMIKAICKAVADFPMINARYDDEAGEVTRYRAVHLGLATQTDAGLMVPVIREAQNLTIWQLAVEIARLAEAARTGKAKTEELSGSTLTLTSLGPLGGIATTPVINRPEVAIIGPNKIVERPVFRGETIERAKLMNLSISCDHRVVDGWDAARFVQAVKALLERPVSLFAD